MKNPTTTYANEDAMQTPTQHLPFFPLPDAVHERIDVHGPSGNAFCILGCVKRILKDLHVEPHISKAILAEMKGGDYRHILRTTDAVFGSTLLEQYDEQDDEGDE